MAASPLSTRSDLPVISDSGIGSSMAPMAVGFFSIDDLVDFGTYSLPPS